MKRSRSNSPGCIENVGRRRNNQGLADKTGDLTHTMSNLNQMMMNNMYQQGNMMMAGGMYPNMMMPGNMMAGGMMHTTGMEMMSGTGMDMISQPQIDMTAMAQVMPSGGTMDMNMMGNMMIDPSMMGMGMYSNMANMNVIQEKTEIVLKSCKLTPPPLGNEQAPIGTRPPGCRTIFVGGLPERIRESTMREIFEQYGSIHTLRLSKKNFCHIKFDRENSVDAAIALSGYRIKLTDKGKDKDKTKEGEDNDSNGNSGVLHVDYAMSRDDQNEYKRKQKLMLRAQEQAQLLQYKEERGKSDRSSTVSRRRSPSPVRVQPFSNSMITQTSEKIKSEEHFAMALPTLIAWLERGECSKKNSTQFYSMIQATNTHIRRLFNEKVQFEEELLECKDRVKSQIEGVIEQLEQVGRVFTAATHQRVWDHFTKAQRKNIETWQKMSQEFSNLKEEFNEKFDNEDLMFNGDMKSSNDGTDDNLMLKRENESLKFQLEAYKNEVEVIKADSAKEMEKFKAQYIARQALQSAMNNTPKPPSLPPPPPPPPPLEEVVDKNQETSIEVGSGEAKLISILSSFLQVHPQGASLDYVSSYVRAMLPREATAAVLRVLRRHTDVFRAGSASVGADTDTRWTFVGYET